jgi:hypothetical protein
MVTSPGFSNSAGQLDHHSVDAGEPPQRHPLVLDTVGAAHDSDVGVPVEQRGVDRRGILGLRGDHHDVVVARYEFVDRGDHIDVDDLDILGRPQRQSLFREWPRRARDATP